ncbi:HesA/MoeB/ThiF family protein [Levilactobacillus koreensis]|uniref:Molybdopterin biosynthesis protein MoeB n=1 Tax=Levilactobacillus koreensis TaxID=637971 RepID=A0AAC8UVA2_9LACO|nr:HesA/MoeB/ThiF family protein [Levilactobacillus koreensis]AKP64359.1 molybdopterin biosynthesis protein MoeB [Levilactobacillus koreensis]
MTTRYDRQERVKVIGVAGQAKISAATILIAGAGALGSYAAEQLVRAGVGHLVLVDPDVVSTTNLQRQTLFTEADVAAGTLKVVAAKAHLLAINHAVTIDAIPGPLTADLLLHTRFDLLLDCLDNYQARDLINKAALKRDFDYIFASCAGTFGSVMPISPRRHACLSCVYPNLDDLKQTDCDLIGVNTALVPLVSALQVSLALHYLVDKPTVDFDHLTTIDNWQLDQQKFKVRKSVTCPVCHHTDWDLTEPAAPQAVSVLCGTQTYSAAITTPNLTTVIDWLVDRHVSVRQFKAFITFDWQDATISIFQNGKVLLYGLPDLPTATRLFTGLRQVLPLQEVSAS